MPKYLDGAGLSHFWESIKPKLGGVTKSGSGTVVSSDDAANLSPLSLTIHGKSVQDGTPSPSSPVKIQSVESRNLSPFFLKPLDDSTYWYTTNNLIAYGTPLDDGWVHFDSLNVNLNISPKWSALQLKPNTTYYLMFELRNGTYTSNTIYGRTYKDNAAPWNAGTSVAINNDGVYLLACTTLADVSSSAITHVRTFFTCNSSATFTGDLRVSIYEGASEYQPYDALILRSYGKNLWHTVPSTVVNGVTVTAGADGSVTLSGTATATINREVLFTVPSTGTYTISGCPSGGGASTYQLWTYDRTGGDAQITDTGSGGSGTLTAGHVIALRIRVQNGYTCNNVIIKPQLELGSTATEYEPHTEVSVNIPLRGHALRSLPDGTEDTLEVDGEGNVTLTKRVGSVTFDGTENWTVTSGRNYGTYTGLAGTIQTPPTTTTPTNSYCNLVPPVQAQNASATPNIYITEGIAVGSTGNVFLNLVGNAGGTTVDALKAALAATPAEFLYPLATPQTISLGKIDLPSLPSPSFSLHVDALVTPTLDAEWFTEGGGKVIDAVSTRITALESEVDSLQADVAELQGQVPEREVLYDTSTWTVIRYGRTVMVQVHGATATPSTSTALITGILADYKPAYNCSATVLTSSGSSTQAARMAVYADTGNVYIVPAGYSSSASWYGTLTYIY